MDEREKVRLLAERLCGYYQTNTYDVDGNVDGQQFTKRGDIRHDRWFSFDPLTSRDDAHECLAKLTDAQQYALIYELDAALCNETDGYYAHQYRVLTATPAQISEALVKVVLEAEADAKTGTR